MAIQAVSSVCPIFPSLRSVFHMVANWSSVRSSRVRRSRRLAFHSGALARPRRPQVSAVVRRLSMDSILLASWTTWKWSTTTVACGRPMRIAAR
ncbi:hypothetical protein K4749_39260 [Streptomyces sp. TRM72054]|nr:hypothetical protein [Streptomyces sp. TRM72054]MBX9399424.1 hypothetical protein [Streptomyces sp. TRM72054]